MLTNDYQYAFEYYREDGTPLGQVSVTVDWEPAQEWARFVAIRHGRLATSDLSGATSIHPIWHPASGEPYLGGFRVSVSASEGNVSSDFTTAYFKALAHQISSRFVETGQLKSGERFRYVAAAFPRPDGGQVNSTVAFATEEVAPSLALRETNFAEAARGAVPHDLVNAEEMPVLVPQRVLDEAAVLGRHAGAKETGGILIGHLHRDSGRPEIFAQVTAQIEARHTQADLTKLTFTSETWTDVRATLHLRRKDEIMLGWWHSHPVREWCKNCPIENQKVCPMSAGFFSTHDHALHRVMFPRAFSIALVVNHVAFGAATFSLFGWKQGLLESRGFYITGAPVPTTEDVGGNFFAPEAPKISA